MEVRETTYDSYVKYDESVVSELVGKDNFEKLVVVGSAYDGRLVQVNYDGLGNQNDEITPANDLISEYRGVVFDTKAGVPIAGGSNHTKKIVHDGSPIELDEDEYIVIRDTDGKEHHFPYFSTFIPRVYKDLEDVTVEQYMSERDELTTKKPVAGVNLSITNRVVKGVSTLVRDYAQGSVLMFYQWNYDVFVSTHKRIFGEKSSWQTTTPFYTTYKTIGGPSTEALFDPKCRYSPYCYRFLVTDSASHPTATRMMMPRIGYLTFLGVQKMWEHDDPERGVRGPYRYSPEPLDENDDRDYVEFPDMRSMKELLDLERMCNLKIFSRLPDQPQKYNGFIYYPKQSYSLDVINEMLTTGYRYTKESDPTGEERISKMKELAALDYRLGSGEAVFLTYYSLSNGRSYMINTLVKSRAYEYRLKLHQGDRSLLKDMLRYMQKTLKHVSDDQFASKVPQVLPVSSGTLFNMLETHTPDPVASNPIMTPQLDQGSIVRSIQREDRAAYYFLYTVNPSRQKLLVKQWKNYIQQRQALVEWLVKLSNVERVTIDDDFDKLIAAVCQRINSGAEIKANNDGKKYVDKSDKIAVARMIILTQLNPEREVYNLILKHGEENAQGVIAKNLKPVKPPKEFSGFASWNSERKPRERSVKTEHVPFRDTTEYKRSKSQVKTRGKMVNVGGKWIARTKIGNV